MLLDKEGPDFMMHERRLWPDFVSASVQLKLLRQT